MRDRKLIVRWSRVLLIPLAAVWLNVGWLIYQRIAAAWPVLVDTGIIEFGPHEPTEWSMSPQAEWVSLCPLFEPIMCSFSNERPTEVVARGDLYPHR